MDPDDTRLKRVEWTPALETGIDVIDAQHKRIVDYINQLVDHDQQDWEELALLVESLVDYTYSHFAFEEALMEQAEYEFLSVHQRTHQAFRERVEQMHERFINGDNISLDISYLLRSWLIDHIMKDDQSYVPAVKAQLPSIKKKDSSTWLSSTIKRIFG
jgi:hemerythrin